MFVFVSVFVFVSICVCICTCISNSHETQLSEGSSEALRSQVPQPLLLVVGWVYNTPKTVKFFFASFHRVHFKGIVDPTDFQVSWGT